jgi:hypothetical protein
VLFMCCSCEVRRFHTFVRVRIHKSE